MYTKSFQSIISLFHKTVSTSSLKNLKKSEKFYFQTLKTFVFGLKVASKQISKKFYLVKFWFKKFSTTSQEMVSTSSFK